MRLFSANEGTLEPYLSQFDVEKLEMASVMGMCGSLVGPKSGNVEKALVFKAFLKGPLTAERRKCSIFISFIMFFLVVKGSW